MTNQPYTHMATIYHPADAPREITPANGTNFTLEEMQGIVGGYIQIINLGNGNVMVINEEGKLLNLPKNAHATLIAHQHKAIFPLDYVVGTALVCHENEA